MSKYALFEGLIWRGDVEADSEEEALKKVPGADRVELIKSE